MLSITDIESLNRHWDLLTIGFDEEFSDTYKMIHQAVQFLAITGKSVLPPKFDDSHTSFTWNDKNKCFTSELIHDDRTFRLEFDPLKLVLTLAPSKERTIGSFCLAGKTKKEVYAQLRHLLNLGGITIQHFSTEMHYDLPEHIVCKGGKYQVHAKSINEELIKHFSNAHLVLNAIKDKNPSTGPIRCWPHHFDISTDTILYGTDKNKPGYFSIGFSPANTDLPEPHFFFNLRHMSGYKLVNKSRLKYGRWLSGNTTGTLLGLMSLIKKPDISSQVEIVCGFLNESYSTLLEHELTTGKVKQAFNP